MPTVKMLQDWKSRKEGETWSPSESTARLLVASGKAVLVEEPRVDPEPVTVPAVMETEPPAVVPDAVVIETGPPVVESTSPEPGFQELPAEVLPPQPSRYAPHRSWTRQSES